jgi:hypothetical protein
MNMQTKIILAIVIIATAALAIAPALANTVFAASPKHKVCPGTGDCNGDSGNHNPNAYCTTNGDNRPNCGGT